MQLWHAVVMESGYVKETGGGGGDGVDLAEDRRGYSAQGKVTLLVLVALFALVIFSLVLCLYLHRLKRIREDREADCTAAAAAQMNEGSKRQVYAGNKASGYRP